MQSDTKTKSNKQFMILSTIAILLVVICHFADTVNDAMFVFPPTSFFMSLFIFISGYFYNIKKEENIGKSIWHKFKKVMIPFFIINLCYGIFCSILRYYNIINYGTPINLYTLFIQPFINNNQFIFNFPSWFVPTFFVTYVVYLLIHKLSSTISNIKILKNSKVKFLNEYILLVIFLIVGIVAVYFKDITKAEDLRTLLLKVAFFLPMFQIGFLYQTKWQKYDDKIKTALYLPILIIINLILIKIFGNLRYDMHEFSGFQGNVLLPFITSVTGILFWLRISRVLSKWLGDNKVINYISNNTFSIMSHHLLYIFLFNIILYWINLKYQVPYFDITKFKDGWIYIYKIPNWDLLLQIAYVMIGVGGPIITKYVFDKLRVNIKLYKSKKIR